MNIIVTWNYDRYFLNFGSIIYFLIAFVIGIGLLCLIMGLITYLFTEFINKMMVKYRVIDIIIGDNGEKLLLVNTSDIENARSYLAKLSYKDDVKYIFNIASKETYKVIGGIDLALVDHYDENI